MTTARTIKFTLNGEPVELSARVVMDPNAGGKVQAKVLAQGRTDKVSIIKFKRRTTYKRMGTHRQSFTLVEITGITARKIVRVHHAPDELPEPRRQTSAQASICWSAPASGSHA